MRYGAEEIAEAIIGVCERRGADGCGKDGLDGRMFMLASTDCRRFGTLLGRALWWKTNARCGTHDERPEFITKKEAKAQLREAGIPERVVDFLPAIDPRELPAEQRYGARPNGTRVITEAVINAAIRHGSDGRGKDGFPGYLDLLERIEPVTFDMLTRMALQWQLKHPPRPPKLELDPLMRDYLGAVLKKCREERWGPETRHTRKNPYPDPES
jgi:hypothetical protein